MASDDAPSNCDSEIVSVPSSATVNETESSATGASLGATYGVTDIVAVAVSEPPSPSDTVYVNEASPEKYMAGVNVHC